MGLDMYLQAERRFALGSPEAQTILAAAEAPPLPWKDEWGRKEFDLGLWGFEGPQPKRERALAEAGLFVFRTEHSHGAGMQVGGEVLKVHITAMYWRKANAIHNWFVQECQGGVDECQMSDPINYEQLAELAGRCRKSVALFDAGKLEQAREQLTPRAGFFFGSTDIDEWWREDVKRTAIELEAKVRLAIETGGVTFTYQSSW